MSVALAWRIARDPAVVETALDEVGQAALAASKAKIALLGAKVRVEMLAQDVTAEWDAALRRLAMAGQWLALMCGPVREAEEEVLAAKDKAGRLCPEWGAGLTGAAATAAAALDLVGRTQATMEELVGLAGQALQHAGAGDETAVGALKTAMAQVEAVYGELDAVLPRLREAR
ncbi:hypothetical protein [Streptoalloteichus hindustanus]|uniref:Uncharacterized protein n=1 Tax=Streptoalloteichus hindustanus TaxID=2017 RepID=A0A1M5QG04_STRHI|nr:hypothetical protein [Streptoalloteichus hindustanus]SHH12791.1 hypothetical protein SAMN05444320_1249 [Streptoalloteichus hindustanus]